MQDYCNTDRLWGAMHLLSPSPYSMTDRPICCSYTDFAVVFQARNWLPDGDDCCLHGDPVLVWLKRQAVHVTKGEPWVARDSLLAYGDFCRDGDARR